MKIFKEIINLCKDYFQKEKMMAKAYEEITEKMEDGISLADQIVDVLKENKKLKARIVQAKEIIKEYYDLVEIMLLHHKIDTEKSVKLEVKAEQFLKEL